MCMKMEMDTRPVDVCIKNGNDEGWCKNVCKNVGINNLAIGDSLDLLKCLESNSIDLIVTSPPYADMRANYYGGVEPDKYIDWFMPIAKEIKRVLKPSGSFVLNIKDKTVNKTRHPYVYQLVLDMINDGWKWIDTYVWVKPNPIPTKAHYKLKDGFEYIYHFTKTFDFKRNWDAVKQPMKSRNTNENNPNYFISVKRPSGRVVKESNFSKLNGLALPSNVLTIGISNNRTNHPAVFPEKLPEFFIKAFTDSNDIVLDPFIGSGTTGVSAKKNCRNYIGFDKFDKYIEIAKNRIDSIPWGCNKKP